MTIETLRETRIFDYAIFDLTLAFLGIIILSPILTKIFRKLGVNIPFQSWLFLTLPISILIHVLTGNFTLMTKQFLDLNGNYILKIVIFILLFIGLSKIKFIRR